MGGGLKMIDLETITQQMKRRQEILDKGISLMNLDEYNTLTLKLAESVPTLVRALKGVMTFRNELIRHDSLLSPIARAIAVEIDRALKGQRKQEESK